MKKSLVVLALVAALAACDDRPVVYRQPYQQPVIVQQAPPVYIDRRNDFAAGVALGQSLNRPPQQVIREQERIIEKRTVIIKEVPAKAPAVAQPTPQVKPAVPNFSQNPAAKAPTITAKPTVITPPTQQVQTRQSYAPSTTYKQSAPSVTYKTTTPSSSGKK